MFYVRFFFYVMMLANFPSFAFANFETITSLMSVKDKVDSLQRQGATPKDIVVVWDCHGVITAQGTPRKGVESTLNPDALTVLGDLNAGGISQVISTAWHNPYEVQKDLQRLQVTPFFDAENSERRDLEIVTLGKNKSLQGHKIGRITALREHEEFPVPYFRKKAFGAEWCFPGNNFKHIIFVDDDRHNLDLFEKDFKETIYYNSEEDMEKLTLYHFSMVRPNPMYTFPSNSSSDNESDDEF